MTTTGTAASLAEHISAHHRLRRTWNPLSDAGLDELAWMLRLERAGTLLDIGCGTGTVACDWAEQFDLDTFGVDITAPYVESAIRQAGRRRVQAAFEQVDARALPDRLSGRRFHRVVCLGVAGGLGGWQATVDLVAGLTEPGGMFAVGDQLPRISERLTDVLDAGHRLAGVIRSTVADQDAYYSDQWQAVLSWAAAEPDHPRVGEQLSAVRRHQMRYLSGECPDLDWGVLVFHRSDR